MARDAQTQERRREALDRFEAATELPLLLLALAMIPLLVIPLVVELSETVETVFYAVDWFIWAAFLFEYVVRLTLTDRRGRFMLRNWPDLLIIVLPFLRPLRVVRSARALRLLRLARLAAIVGVINEEGRRLLRRHKLHYALVLGLVIVVLSAGLVAVLEEGEGGSITDFGTALWWAITTITTVGYGDTYPVTDAGRGVAAFLMIAGITIFGLLTANLAAFFLEHGTEEEREETARVEAKLDEILARMATVEAALAERPDGD